MKHQTAVSPKITIILPVYNVEPYLRQCLDSVINQTMPEIQVICVNDGSTDGSREILQEYADRDSRIEIIDQENQGAGSARNAAYPYIKGKYTYFADPDDWLKLNLCEKTHAVLEETGADAVVFHATNTETKKTAFSFDLHLAKIRCSPQEKFNLLLCESPWRKVWNTNFLIKGNLFFCEGKRPHNDTLQHWRGIIQANKIATHNEALYKRRVRPNSYQTVCDNSRFVIIKTMNDLKHFLRESGYYPFYKEIYFDRKFVHYFRTFNLLSGKLQQEFKKLIRENFANEDREFLHSVAGKCMSNEIRLFYKMIGGELFGSLKYHWRYGKFFLERQRATKKLLREIKRPFQQLRNLLFCNPVSKKNSTELKHEPKAELTRTTNEVKAELVRFMDEKKNEAVQEITVPAVKNVR